MGNALASIRVQATSGNNVAGSSNNNDPLFIYSGATLKAILDSMGAEIKGQTYDKTRADNTVDVGRRLRVTTKAKRTLKDGNEIDVERIQTINISSKIAETEDYIDKHLDEFYVGQSANVAPEYDLMDGEQYDRLVDLTIITFQEASTRGVQK